MSVKCNNPQMLKTSIIPEYSTANARGYGDDVTSLPVLHLSVLQ